MLANAKFISNFAQMSAPLPALTHGNARFIWTDEHTTCFNYLLDEFRQSVLLRYFDLAKRTFVIVDAHLTGLGAILAQGDDTSSLKPVAFASRTTQPLPSI